MNKQFLTKIIIVCLCVMLCFFPPREAKASAVVVAGVAAVALLSSIIISMGYSAVVNDYDSFSSYAQDNMPGFINGQFVENALNSGTISLSAGALSSVINFINGYTSSGSNIYNSVFYENGYAICFGSSNPVPTTHFYSHTKASNDMYLDVVFTPMPSLPFFMVKTVTDGFNGVNFKYSFDYGSSWTSRSFNPDFPVVLSFSKSSGTMIPSGGGGYVKSTSNYGIPGMSEDSMAICNSIWANMNGVGLVQTQNVNVEPSQFLQVHLPALTGYSSYTDYGTDVLSGTVSVSSEVLTVSAVGLNIISYPTKTYYQEGELFDNTGLTVGIINSDGSVTAVDTQSLVFTPGLQTPLTTSNTFVGVSSGDLSATIPITVVGGEAGILGTLIGFWETVKGFFANFWDWVDGLGDTIKQSVSAALSDFFTLDSSLANDIKESFQSKFGFVFAIGSYVSDFMDDFSIGSPPAVYLNLGNKSSGYSYGNQSVAVLDMSWFAPYRATSNAILSAFVYLLFLLKLYKTIPKWLEETK